MSRKRKKRNDLKRNKSKKTWKQSLAGLDKMTILFFSMGFVALCYSYYQVFQEWNVSIFGFNVIVTIVWLAVFVRSVKRGGFY